MASSEALAQAAYGNAQQRNENQKTALLDAVAQAGAAGRQQYEQAGKAINADRQAAIQYAATQGAGGQNLLAGQQDLGFLGGRSGALDTLAAVNQTAGATLQGDISRQQANIGEYYGKLDAAIPVEQARTQGMIEQILQEARDKEADRAYNQQMRQMQLEMSRNALSASKNKPKTKEEESQFLTEFYTQADQALGPKQFGVVQDVIGNAKDKGSALARLQELSRLSKNFTQDITDDEGNVLAPVKNVDIDVIRQYIDAYYNGQLGPSRETFDKQRRLQAEARAYGV